MSGGKALVTLGAVIAGLSACASSPDGSGLSRSERLLAALEDDLSKFKRADDQVIADPFEPMNRRIYAMNVQLDKYVLAPTAGAYETFVPNPARESARSFIDNLKGPVWLINDMLQGEWDLAGQTATRFALNSTFGVVGLYDFADHVAGIPKHDEDFGQTLGAHGVGNGPYLMLPVLGPSTTRDAFGRVVDTFTLDPINLTDTHGIVEYRLGLTAADTIDIRYRTDAAIAATANGADPYAQVRSLYVQTRQGSVRNGRDAFADLPDFDFD